MNFLEIAIIRFSASFWHPVRSTGDWGIKFSIHRHRFDFDVGSKFNATLRGVATVATLTFGLLSGWMKVPNFASSRLQPPKFSSQAFFWAPWASHFLNRSICACGSADLGGGGIRSPGSVSRIISFNLFSRKSFWLAFSTALTRLWHESSTIQSKWPCALWQQDVVKLDTKVGRIGFWKYTESGLQKPVEGLYPDSSCRVLRPEKKGSCWHAQKP